MLSSGSEAQDKIRVETLEDFDKLSYEESKRLDHSSISPELWKAIRARVRSEQEVFIKEKQERKLKEQALRKQGWNQLHHILMLRKGLQDRAVKAKASSLNEAEIQRLIDLNPDALDVISVLSVEDCVHLWSKYKSQLEELAGRYTRPEDFTSESLSDFDRVLAPLLLEIESIRTAKEK